MDKEALRDIARKKRVFAYAEEIGNIAKACRYFGISPETFCDWSKRYATRGDAGLVNSKPCPQNPKLRVPQAIEAKILYLRRKYHFGPARIAWSLERYFDMKASTSGVYQVLVRNGMNVLPKGKRTRAVKSFKRHEKRVPGRRVQIDVKFLTFHKGGRKIRRYQFTAIDDATRAGVLRVYDRHTQANAIDLVDHVRRTSPFRIHTVQIDNGHEYQAKFHWHCEDLGMTHVYIKPRSPHLNGKVERSHKTDAEEFSQLVGYVDDIDIRSKLKEWESYYNCHRPHAALKGKAPFEVLRERLLSGPGKV
ncbi:IS481 family transposase [Leisingera aquaemixtae]|nr:IS481 family transposase [Leisingera aquaemixtae]QDI74814.1 IS481 family transposase [Leisingera aquaemixtae]